MSHLGCNPLGFLTLLVPSFSARFKCRLINSARIFSCAVVDPCLSNPCQHGGSCERESDGFKCKCVTGFNGTQCEKGKKVISLY